jgi:AcrR family transcriptional regulator
MQRKCVTFATVQASEASEAIPFPLLVEQLPSPPTSLDSVLDATIECVSRHGLAKTSLSDIARELGVAPSTVYRKVGTVPNAAVLVMAREGHRMLERIPKVIAGVEGPRVITVFLADSIQTTANHPMVQKIVRDETEWVGRVATRSLEERLGDAADVAAPLLAAAMASGHIRKQDPIALAHWLTRISLMCLVAPPPGDLLESLDLLLLPLLDPTTHPNT